MQSRGHVSHFAWLFATEQSYVCLKLDRNHCMLCIHQKREDDSNLNYVEKRLSSSTNPNHTCCASFEWDLISSSVHAIENLNPYSMRVQHSRREKKNGTSYKSWRIRVGYTLKSCVTRNVDQISPLLKIWDSLLTTSDIAHHGSMASPSSSLLALALPGLGHLAPSSAWRLTLASVSPRSPESGHQ